jgi:hypothetical protein
MTTLRRRVARRSAGALAASLVLGVILTACTYGGSATAGAPSAAVDGPSPSTAPSAGPGEPASNPPDTVGPGNGGDAGGGAYVVPRPGQIDVHPIAADSLAAQVDGRHVVLTITYTSGVEPCSVLDTIVVERGQGSFVVTLRQGHGPGNQVCIMIAMVMKTQVDLGDLDPGAYTVSDAMRGAAPIQVVVD